MNPENIKQPLKYQESAENETCNIFKIYSEIEEKFEKHLKPSKELEIKDYKETIRNLILINGAIAAFELPLLSNSEIIKWPLVLSSILLLTNIIIAYWYLQRGWTKNFKAFIFLENKVIKPISIIRELALKTIRGKENLETLLIEHKKFTENNGNYDKILNEISNILPNKEKLNKIDTLLIVLFTSAILLLIYAIVGNNINYQIFILKIPPLKFFPLFIK